MENNSLSTRYRYTKDTVPLWLRKLRTKIQVFDILAIIVAVALSYYFRFDTDLSEYLHSHIRGINYLMVSAAMILVWVAAIFIANFEDPKDLGYGFEEYKKIFNTTLIVFGAVAIISYVAKIQVARVFVAFAFPIGLLLMLLNHWVWRKWLHRQRAQDKCMYNVVLIGNQTNLSKISDRLLDDVNLGYRVKGLFLVTETTNAHQKINGIPVTGTAQQLIPWLQQQESQGNRIDTVMVTSRISEHPDFINELSWQLENVASTSSLIVSSQILDVSNERITMRHTEGLPLVYLEFPELEGAKATFKRTFDIIGSILAIIITSPIMIITIIAIKLEDGGPAFFTQKRVGRFGEVYSVYKFRSMRTNVDAIMAKALEKNPHARHELKGSNDPRITKVGKLIRRYSIDELPQFFNVLQGWMSVVGPRPLAADEVNLDERYMHRRLYVRPGITGLWQVSGRSETSWEERMDLDFQYVENWSPALDILILLKTVKVVITGEGAY